KAGRTFRAGNPIAQLSCLEQGPRRLARRNSHPRLALESERNRDPNHRHARGEPPRKTSRRFRKAAHRPHRSRQRLHVRNNTQMNRPLQTWLLFGGSLALLPGGMVWATLTAVGRVHGENAAE